MQLGKFNTDRGKRKEGRTFSCIIPHLTAGRDIVMGLLFVPHSSSSSESKIYPVVSQIVHEFVEAKFFYI